MYIFRLMKVFRSHQMISGFLLENPVDGLPALEHCGEALCCSRHVLQPHFHAGYEFVYITRGRAFWKMGDRPVHQQMGDLFITYPRELHESDGEPGIEFHLLWIGLDLKKLGREGRRLETLLAARRPALLSQCHEMEGVLRGIALQASGERPVRERIILQYLRTFVSLVEQRVRMAEATGPAKRGALLSHPVHRALDFMRGNLDRRVSLRELSRAATGGSVARFCERFRREVGVAPGTHHLRLRLDEARLALRHPEARVTQVAMRFGFSSSQHFSTAFRRMFGVTPRAWRAGVRTKRRG